MFGLDLHNIFQYPKGNFPSSTEFWEFFLNFPKISNAGIPVSFTGLRRDGNWPVPIGGTETRSGRGSSRMLGTGNFPGKWHSGTQTSTRWVGGKNLSIADCSQQPISQR